MAAQRGGKSVRRALLPMATGSQEHGGLVMQNWRIYNMMIVLAVNVFLGLAMRFASRRNPLPLPPIQHEELLDKPIKWKHYGPGWQEIVCTDCRLNMHHTLASIRKDCHLKGPLRPQHSVDLALSAIYQHGPEDFPEKSDTIRQPETARYPTWRLLKNHRHDPRVVPINLAGLRKGQFSLGSRSPFQFGEGRSERLAREGENRLARRTGLKRGADPTHPLRLGGLVERRSPFNVKLGIGSHHSPQSNNGYSRNSYGAFYTS